MSKRSWWPFGKKPKQVDPQTEYGLPIFVPKLEQTGVEMPPVSQRSAETDQTLLTNEMVAIRQLMLNEADANDYADIAQALELPVPDGGKGRQTLALIQAAQRAKKLPQLLNELRSRYPNVAWPH